MDAGTACRQALQIPEMNMEDRSIDDQGDRSVPEAPAPATPQPSTRRRFMGGAAGGVGVLLAVQARTALGQGICHSPSENMSGNASPQPESPTCWGGLSPGFWKQPHKFGFWEQAGALPPTIGQIDCTKQTGSGKLSYEAVTYVDPPAGNGRGTTVVTFFPEAVGFSTGRGAPVTSATGIWEVLAFPKDIGGQHLRHLIAARLNAGFNSSYPISLTQIREMWLALLAGTDFCPGAIDCSTGGMNPDEVKQYIDGLYHTGTPISSRPSDRDLTLDDFPNTCTTP